MSGRILVAEEDGVFLMKFEGDVRITLCAAIDRFLDTMFETPSFKAVIVDLCDAQGVDSTTLGILAKLSMQVQTRFGVLPDLVCDAAPILRLLHSMGFDDVFSIRTDRTPIERALLPVADLRLLESGSRCAELESETQMHKRVLAAHKLLMQLNPVNQERFRDLVATLEASETYPPDQAHRR